MGYGFTFQGKTYEPNGQVNTRVDSVAEKNRETERQEIAWLQTGPANVFLYVHMPKSPSPTASYSNTLRSCCRVARDMHAIKCPVCQQTVSQMDADAEQHAMIQTWLGTPVATHVRIGPSRRIGFGYHSSRRAVSCRINGVLYHGWYFESSGDYCRLRKAKRQPTTAQTQNRY